MSFVHFSDTHLGARDVDAVDPATGINLREQDLYRAFDAVIDAAIRLRPDAVIHAGDLFDSVHPSNRAICTALEGFRRLSDAGIPAVVIAGNHDTPRVPGTASALRTLSVIPGIHAAWDGAVVRLEVAGTVIHAVGDAPTTEGLEAALSRVERAPGRRNILVAHAGTPHFAKTMRSGEFNEHLLPVELLRRFDDFDYIALGHYHRHLQVEGTRNAWYCGSTERMSFNELKNRPGFVEVGLAPLTLRHHAIASRSMIDLGVVDLRTTADPVAAVAAKAAATPVRNAIARVRIAGLTPERHAALDLPAIREIGRDALSFQVALEFESTGTTPPAPGPLETLQVEFDRFVAARELPPGIDRARLARRGADLLARVEAGHET